LAIANCLSLLLGNQSVSFAILYTPFFSRFRRPLKSGATRPTYLCFEKIRRKLEKIHRGLVKIRRGLEKICRGLVKIHGGLVKIRRGLEQISRGLVKIHGRLVKIRRGLEKIRRGLEKIRRYPKRFRRIEDCFLTELQYICVAADPPGGGGNSL
jgi:hypothetical protein